MIRQKFSLKYINVCKIWGRSFLHYTRAKIRKVLRVYIQSDTIKDNIFVV